MPGRKGAPVSIRLSRSCAQRTRPEGRAARTKPGAAPSSGRVEKASDRIGAESCGATGTGARPKGAAPGRKGRTDMEDLFVHYLFLVIAGRIVNRSHARTAGIAGGLTGK